VIALMLALILVLSVGLGCGGNKEAGTSTQPSKAATQPSTQQGSATTAGPIVLSGSGTQPTQTFSLSKGLAVSTMQYSGGTKFKAVLLDSAGTQIDVLADVTTNLSGSTASGVPGGQYVVNVDAVGAWEIDVVEAVPATLPQIPLTFTGTGPVATQFFQSLGGSATVRSTFSGTGKFTVKLLNSSGDTVNVLADTTGAYDNTATVPLAAGVAYLFDIEGVGPWTVNIQ
jgi:hypothetical protein